MTSAFTAVGAEPTKGPPPEQAHAAASARRNVPASFGQASLWLVRQLMPYPSAYNTAVQFRLSGELDAGALDAGLRESVRRHESFRVTFAVVEGAVLQVIHEEMAADIATIDLASAPDPEAEARRLAEALATAPFDLQHGPLFRARVLRLSPRDHLLVVVMDHIIADGTSLNILWRELEAAYRGAPLPAPVKQYAECVAAQKQWLETPAFARHLDYWTKHLQGAVACDLPADRPRPPARSYRGSLEIIDVPAPTVARLRSVCAEAETSFFASLLASLDVLLARYSGQSDVVVLVPMASRQRFAADQVVGYFANMVVLRNEVPDQLPFVELVRRVNKEIMAGVLRQDVPFAKVIEALRPDRSLGDDPLGRISLSFFAHPGSALDLPAIEATYRELPNGGGKFDLSLIISEHAEDLTVSAEYNSDIFDAATVRALLEHYLVLLESAGADPGCAVGDLTLLTPDERHRLLVAWNDTARPYPRDQCLHQLFAAQAAAVPEAVAIGYEGRTLTYRELDEQSSCLARHLVERGAAPDALVGLAMDRSPAMVVGLLGILKAGAAYVPLDPTYPKERLAFVIEDAGIRLLVSETRVARGLPEHRAAVVLLDDPEALPRTDTGPLPARGSGIDRAYVIYTSGSTGRPKGVEIPHAAVVNFLATMADRPGLGPEDRLLAVTSLSFDIAGLELWLPLTVGARVEIAGREAAADGAALLRLIEAERITVMQGTPSTFRLLLAVGWKGSRDLKVLVGGEAVPLDLADQLVDRAASVWNMYGPTETTIWSTVHRLDKGAPVLIGKPIANTRTYVLDRKLSPVPAGVVGELFIGGDGVAHGYLGRPELTAERFVPDPFSSHPPARRLYRTGDLARHRPDGTLEFLGRVDFQVKVRGFRIELGEIEATLAKHPDVREAVVLAREDAPGDKRLVAYVAGPRPPSADELRGVVRKRLPEYMVPSAFVALDALPLTPNGKIDRKALPAPAGGAGAGADGFVAPSTPAEELLAGIWADLLGLPRVGVTDDFFALGGHSLLGMRVLGRVRAAFGVELPLRALFETRTVALLAARIQRGARAETPPIARVPREGTLPLSFAQQRLWFLDRLEPQGSAYNLPVALRLEGALDAGALERSLAEMVRRHEALRTTFVTVDGEPCQVIASAPSFSMPVVDVSAAADVAAEALRLASAEAQLPFDLARGPLFRATLFKLGERDHLLLVATHHIVSDGWSEGVLGRELSALYAAFSAGLPSPLPELPVQPADHAVWQRAQLTGPVLDDLISYARQRFRGAPPALDLPTDRPRPPVQGYRGTTCPFVLPRELSAALGALSRREGVTLFMTLLAAFQVLLHRYTGQGDIVVGSPVAGRNRPEIEGLIGFFVSTLVLRTQLGDEPTLRELLGRVREAALDAYAHQDLPFERLVEAVVEQRDLSRSPVFQAMIILQNAPPAPPSLGPVSARRVEVERGSSKFDLTLLFQEAEGGEGLAGFLEYPTALFDAATIARMAGHLRMLLEGAVADPGRRISELPLLTAEERHALLVGWNDTARPYPSDQCLHQRFAAQAAAAPDAVAIGYEGRTLTYRELDQQSTALARHLVERGAAPGALVGLAMDRSPAMVVGLLGILKAGAAYVPLDPTYPKERLAFVIEDAGIRLLVSETRVARGLPEHRAAVVLLDDPEALPRTDTGPLPARGSGADRAYVIYTSGSTGRPKGVEIPHAAVVNFLAAMADRPGLGPEDRLLAVTSLSFDIAGLELWLPLTVGARVEIAGREAAADGAALLRLIEAERITVMQGTPSTFRLLLAVGWKGSRDLKVLIGGEAVPLELADQLVDRAASVWNMYGPTETTIWSTVQRIEKGDPVLIGKPIANTRTYVLDRKLSPVPVGVVGELFIGGDGVAHGYLGRPELTAERFVPDPFPSHPPARRLYRTGDLARHRPDGALEFLGRADFQVKVRGFRIELGEIETTLARHPAVREAVVVAREETPGDTKLVAYVTAAGEAEIVPADLRAHARATLPEYMVPARFVVLEKLPLTANNKIDRKALPEPSREAGTAAGTDAAPREALELKLRGIWEKVLGVQGIGIRDSFFDLGGHSLLAIPLFERIEEAFGIRLPLATIFEAPTIERMGNILRSDGWEPKWTSLVAIQPGGSRPPFFCVHGGGAHVIFYHPMANLMGPDQPFYGLQPKALSVHDMSDPDVQSVEAMAAHYLDELREIQPAGPYLLGGASYGGVIAFEMAQQLLAKGERTALVAMFDTYGPGYYSPPTGLRRLLGVPQEMFLRLEHHAGSLAQLDPGERVPYVRSKIDKAVEESLEVVDEYKRQIAKGVFTRIGRRLPPELEEVRNAVNEAVTRYRPRPYEGRITLFRARRQAPGTNGDPTLGWGAVARGGVEIIPMPGYHAAMISQPRVRELVPALRDALAKAVAR